FRNLAAGGVLDERTDAYTLVRAIDIVSENDISVLNLSLAGPANTTLEEILTEVAEAGIVIVASTGNGGPRAEPAYPAAYDNVIGVTAVTRSGRVFRRAGRGPHVDFAAPGVEVWTAASVRGVKPRTGTSFATPFVTASVALAQAAQNLTGHDEVVDALAAAARDLGEDGRDDVYGHGLIQAPPSCGPAATLASTPADAAIEPTRVDGDGT
ncbi:MAG: S8 family serine peptidase, partial [Pseudomonadota bacterium]